MGRERENMAWGELLRAEAVLPGNASWKLEAVRCPERCWFTRGSPMSSFWSSIHWRIRQNQDHAW